MIPYANIYAYVTYVAHEAGSGEIDFNKFSQLVMGSSKDDR